VVGRDLLAGKNSFLDFEEEVHHSHSCYLEVVSEVMAGAQHCSALGGVEEGLDLVVMVWIVLDLAWLMGRARCWVGSSMTLCQWIPNLFISAMNSYPFRLCESVVVQCNSSESEGGGNLRRQGIWIEGSIVCHFE